MNQKHSISNNIHFQFQRFYALVIDEAAQRGIAPHTLIQYSAGGPNSRWDTWIANKATPQISTVRKVETYIASGQTGRVKA